MSEENQQPPEQEQEQEADLEDLAAFVVLKLQTGQSQESIVDEILGEDSDKEARHEMGEFVFQIANHLAEVDSAGSANESEFPGWVLWGGLLILVNILSAIFDWPFWVY